MEEGTTLASRFPPARPLGPSWAHDGSIADRKSALVRKAVLVPVYNEIENIRDLLARVRAVDQDLAIVIIDDDSPDGTGRLVAEAQKTDARLHLLKRPVQEGLGLAYLDGFRWALDHGYDLLAQMDGDLSHHPEDLPRLFEELEGCDMVLGSRYIKHGPDVRQALWREWMSLSANAYARRMLGLAFRDVTSGYRAFRREVLDRIFQDPLLSRGYAFQIEVLTKVWRAGFFIREIPVGFSERTCGQSKLTPAVLWEAFRIIARLHQGG
jgi:dolichol-phosphate mannosyltransferase